MSLASQKSTYYVSGNDGCLATVEWVYPSIVEYVSPLFYKRG